MNLLRSAIAHVRSFSNPTPPESPSTTTTENAGTDVADAETPSPSQRQVPTPIEEEQAGINADATPPLPRTPEKRRDVMQTDDVSSDTTIVAADDVETASEKRRRKRREKEARQRQRRSGGGNGTPWRERGEEEGVSRQGQALAGSEHGAVVNEDDNPRVESRVEVGDAGDDSLHQAVKADDDSKAIRVTVREVEVGEEEEEDDDLDGQSTAEEQRLVDQASDFVPKRNERNVNHSEPQLVDPTGHNETDHDGLVDPTPPAPQLVDTPSTGEPKRTKHDSRRSAERALADRTNENSPSQTTTPTIKQLYPKHGLGPTIEIPSKPEHSFIIDSLDPPAPPTTTQPSLPSQPLPNLPRSLDTLQTTNFTDPFRAAHMSAAAHNLLSDRLWRAVQLANYFYSPPARKPAIVVKLPPTFQSTSPRQQRLAQLANRPPPPRRYQAAVEEGVASFLSRTRKNGAGHREMNRFTRANRDMAFYLQTSLALERVVTKREMFEMFEASYGRGEEEGVDWRVDVIGLGVMFDGGDSWRRIV